MQWLFCKKIVFVCLLLFSVPVVAETPQYIFSDHSFGIKAGYPSLFGYYSDELISSGSAGFFYIPFAGERFFLETELSFAAYALNESPDSFLYRTGLYASPSIIFYRRNNLGLYSALTLGGEYVYLNAEKTGQTVSSFKPAAGTGSGVVYYFGRGFSARIGLDYRVLSLSDEYFHSVNMFVGVSYSPEAGRVSSGEYSRRETEKLRSSEREFRKGVDAYNDRNLNEAENHFRKTLEIRPDHPEAGIYLDEIEGINSDIEKALSLSSSEKKIEAIRILEKISPLSREAESELRSIRRSLMPDVESLTQQGVEAYKAGDYEKCVQLMRRALVIDPDNSTARIYHTRASSRIEALEKLK